MWVLHVLYFLLFFLAGNRWVRRRQLWDVWPPNTQSPNSPEVSFFLFCSSIITFFYITFVESSMLGINQYSKSYWLLIIDYSEPAQQLRWHFSFISLHCHSLTVCESMKMRRWVMIIFKCCFIVIWQSLRHFNSHWRMKVSTLMNTRAGQTLYITHETERKKLDMKTRRTKVYRPLTVCTMKYIYLH